MTSTSYKKLTVAQKAKLSAKNKQRYQDKKIDKLVDQRLKSIPKSNADLDIIYSKLQIINNDKIHRDWVMQCQTLKLEISNLETSLRKLQSNPHHQNLELEFHELHVSKLKIELQGYISNDL